MHCSLGMVFADSLMIKGLTIDICLLGLLVEMAIFNIYRVQRAATPKAGSPELQFFMFCTLSDGALYLREVSSKYLERFSTYRADTSTW